MANYSKIFKKTLVQAKVVQVNSAEHRKGFLEREFPILVLASFSILCFKFDGGFHCMTSNGNEQFYLSKSSEIGHETDGSIEKVCSWN